MRKRIAILTGQADEEFQSRFIKGFLEQAHVNDQDVCVFSMFLKYQDSVEREVGEANIFHLPNWDLFDGVAIMKDVIQTPGTNEEIENTLKGQQIRPNRHSLRDCKHLLFSLLFFLYHNKYTSCM